MAFGILKDGSKIFNSLFLYMETVWEINVHWLIVLQFVLL